MADSGAAASDGTRRTLAVREAPERRENKASGNLSSHGGGSNRLSSKAAASEETSRTLAVRRGPERRENDVGGLFQPPASPDYSWMPSRGVRDGSPPRLLARKADAGVLAVRRGGRTRTASPGDRIGRRSRDSWI